MGGEGKWDLPILTVEDMEGGAQEMTRKSALLSVAFLRIVHACVS